MTKSTSNKITTLCCLSLFIASCGQQNMIFKNKKNTQARFLIAADDLAKAETLGLSIEGRQDGYLLGFTDSDNIQKTIRGLPNSVLSTSDISEEVTSYLKQNPQFQNDLYNYDRVKSDLLNWSQEFRSNSELITYGTSTDGRSLQAFHVYKSASSAATKPSVMITGATHGNEILTVDTVMGIAEFVLRNLSIERISSILDKIDIYFIPVVSPDSYVSVQRHVDGVDPNRDFAWPENADHKSTVVIDAISRFSSVINLVGSLDYHSVAGIVMWPWAYTDQSPTDLAKFKTISEKMASANHYDVGQISKVMYIAKGSSADFYYWKTKSLSLGIEISRGRPTTPSSGQDMALENRESTIRYLEYFRDHY